MNKPLPSRYSRMPTKPKSIVITVYPDGSFKVEDTKTPCFYAIARKLMGKGVRSK